MSSSSCRAQADCSDLARALSLCGHLAHRITIFLIIHILAYTKDSSRRLLNTAIYEGEMMHKDTSRLIITIHLAFIALLFIQLATGGCATLVSDERTSVRVTSRRPGATVRINGYNYGVTPLEAKLDKRKDYMVEVTSQDGKAHTCQINSRINLIWVLLDVLSPLSPIAFYIDSFTEQWYSLDAEFCKAPL